MSYDAWKTTDPADADPYRDNDCPSCGAPEGYRCAPECDCDVCAKAHDDMERDELYERQAARDRLDGFARTGQKDWT